MKNWIYTFIAEKNLDLQSTFEITNENGFNLIPLGVVVEHILIATQFEQKEIMKTLIRIDFHNGDAMHFFKHLATAIASKQMFC
tara:strand:+ start:271 stop:522 length:252 start_codon:yes stop_codon:yes gene_type:complete